MRSVTCTGPISTDPLRTLWELYKLGSMTLAPLISWIDREWDAFPNARNSLGLILAALWVPLMLIGWTTLTVSVGVVWTGFWVGLFAWRWLRWIRRLEVRSQKTKPHR